MSRREPKVRHTVQALRLSPNSRVGVDLVRRDRLAEVVARRGEAFLGELFDEAERAALRASGAEGGLERAFARKEAALKALGRGFSGELGAKDVGTAGRLELRGAARTLAGPARVHELGQAREGHVVQAVVLEPHEER